MTRFVLASTSPRRADLLRQIGLDFEIAAPDYEEVMDESIEPNQLARTLALGKAMSVAVHYPEAVIIGADTFAVVDGTYLGKAHNDADARHYLRLLSGRPHMIISGLAVIDNRGANGSTTTIATTTTVHMHHMSDDDITAYIATGEPIGKAGAYAMQGIGSRYVRAIDGEPSNVIGLPVSVLWQHLVSIGAVAG